MKTVVFVLVFVFIFDLALYIVLPQIIDRPFLKHSAQETQENIQKLNNVLLPSEWNVPIKDSEAFTIGIFGGSVAQQLASQKELMYELTDREVRILNFAFGGGAHPAQYNLFRLFHQHIDVAVFLDGFNELFQSEDFVALNSCEQARAFWEQQTFSDEELLLPMMEERIRLETWSQGWWWKPLAYSGFFKWYLFKNAEAYNVRIKEYYSHFDQPTTTHVNKQSLTEHWIGCVRESYRFGQTVNTPIYFFLQPNQYVLGSKEFSQEEKNKAFFSQGKPNAKIWETLNSVNVLYAELDGGIQVLKQEGVPIKNLANIFKDTKATIYTDRCCHVNKEGNRLLYEAILEDVLMN